MGRKPSPKLTLDRIDNNGPYSAANCRWTTISEQNRNTRVNRLIEVDGREMTLVEAAELYEIRYALVYDRLDAGWPIKYALTAPLGSRYKRHRKIKYRLWGVADTLRLLHRARL